MLVLTRGLRQAVVIGNDITVTILEIRGAQVRIGIQAPRSTAVVREKLGETRNANPPAAVDDSACGKLPP
ncbi:MAG: carbon storage regulator [Pseudomonadota bacterium]|nr:carbon storage regulator [Pseudomonadota bacterium]